jgi:hypothetical protein
MSQSLEPEPESWVNFGHIWLSQRNSWPLLSLVYLSPFPAKNEDIASVIGNQVFVPATESPHDGNKRFVVD